MKTVIFWNPVIIISSYREAKSSKTPLSLGYHGNVIDLWWVNWEICTQRTQYTTQVCSHRLCLCDWIVTEIFVIFLPAWSGRSSCWSLREQESSWWIWAQIRPHCTTHTTEATTQSRSASVRPTSSKALISQALSIYVSRHLLGTAIGFSKNRLVRG